MSLIRKIIVPGRDNGHHPHLWRKEGIVIVSVSLFFIILASFLHSYMLTRGISLVASILPSVIVKETNSYRKNAQIAPLIENPLLEKAAFLKATDMAEKGYFSHYTPEGVPPWDFISRSGYEYEKAGENLAVNFFDSRDVAKAWMNSPTHKANMLKEGYKEIGVAAAHGIYKGRDSVFVVQMFGTPKEAKEALTFDEKIETKTASSVPSVLGASIEGKEISWAKMFLVSPRTMFLALTFLAASLIFASFILVWSYGHKKAKAGTLPLVFLFGIIFLIAYLAYEKTAGKKIEIPKEETFLSTE